MLALFDYLLTFLGFAIFVRAILSWLPIDRRNPVVTFVYQATEPVLQPIRRLLPSMGGMDLSPMIAIFLILIARQILSAALA